MTLQPPRPALSIVATMYRSEAFIEEFCERITRSATAITPDFEIVLVNDGSPDASLDRAKAVADRNPAVVVVDLSRNFGHHRAIMIGLEQARGDHVFLIDVDLEEPPESLVKLWGVLSDADADVAFGVQPFRKGRLFERLSGSLFWSLIRKATAMPIPANPLTARLMTRRYVHALIQHREREIFLAGLWHITGFRQIPVPIVKSSRGETSYDLGKRISLFVNSITSFSSYPLALIFYVGITITGLSLMLGLTLVVARVSGIMLLEGWVSVMLSVWFLGGVNFMFLGVIGVYLSRVFTEVKQRPYGIIREIYRCRE